MDFQTYLRQTFQQMDKDNISNKINSAILKFRRHKSTLDDRREAIRELADVLEFLRPAIKQFKQERRKMIF
jgi:MoxR-like ATPase